MPKQVCAIVRDTDAGVTCVEVQAQTSEQIAALAANATSTLSTLDSFDAAAVSCDRRHFIPRCCAAKAVGANGQFWTVLASLVQKAEDDLPVILPEIMQVIQFLGGTQSTSVGAGEKVGANGAILAALGALFQKAFAALPTVLPEIMQLIALFGGSVQVVPAPSAS